MNIPILADSAARGAASDVASPRPVQSAPASSQASMEARAAVQAREAERVRGAAQELDNFLKSSGRSLEFRVDKKSGLVVVSVHDSSTGEVIRQIPNEETLRIAEHLRDPINGGHTVLDMIA